MRTLKLLLLLFFGAGSVFLATRIVERFETGGWGRVEVGREVTARISDALGARVDSLETSLSLTYFVSDKSTMPSSMRDVEAGVTDLLEALEARAPAKIEFQIVDPDERDDLTSFTSERRIVPFRVRTVERDAYSETTVYSTLALSWGARSEATIHGIGPDHLPRLQSLLVEHLEAMENPPRVRVGLAAPPGFEELADELALEHDVVPIDLDGGDPLPTDVDILFWMRPSEVYPETLAELDQFLERGKSLVLAGSLFELGPSAIAREAGELVLRVDPTPDGFSKLAAHLGLVPLDGLVSDQRSDPIIFEGAEHAAPFLVRCIAPNQDFQRWAQQPNGTLLFLAPTPLGLNPEKLAERGVQSHLLGTTSDMTRLGAAPTASAIGFEQLASFGEPTPKLPVIVGLESTTPWAGRTVVFGSTTPFENGGLSRRGTAHRKLVSTLFDELASTDSIVAGRAEIARAEPLPAMRAGERLWWRFVCVFLVPLLLALVALVTLRSRTWTSALKRLGWLRPTLVGLAGLAVVLLGVRLIDGLGWESDRTAEGLHELGSDTVDELAETTGRDATEATLYVSSHGSLPPAWRPAIRRLTERLDRFADAGLLSAWNVVHPDELDDSERRALVERAIEPTEITTVDEGVRTVRSVFATLELNGHGRAQSTHFRDLRGFDELDFAIANALSSLANGRRPRIAFASDVPRMSAAEAYENFQQKGLFAPLGTDIYSLARNTLESVGFDVVHVNPRDPRMPEDVDLVIWMQPRRSVSPMLEVLARHLVGGGKAMVAAQHFVLQARQYRGRGFKHVYWPQPQSHDLEHLWFPEMGIGLVREVLFDERSTRIAHDTRVTGRRASRDVEVQDSALPFLIRTSSANGNPDSPITESLGDQAFLWADHIAVDAELLASAGLEATPLITTSARSWSFPWKGGYLPEEILEGPTELAPAVGKVPLAMRFDGTFPIPRKGLALDDLQEAAEPFDPGDDWPVSAPGSLVVVGCSQLFTNERLYDEEFRARDLLVNVAATLGLDAEWRTLATRRATPRGFDFVEPETRLRWRSLVLGLPTIAMALLALGWNLLRRLGGGVS